MTLTSASQQMFANLLLEKLQANFTLIHCVNLCQKRFNRRYESDADLPRFNPHQNKSRSLKKWSCCILNEKDGTAVLRAFTKQEKVDSFNADGFSGHCNTVFEAMGCFHHYSPCEEAQPALTEVIFERGTRKRKWLNCGNIQSKRKGTLLSKCGNANYGNSTRLMCQ